MFEVVADFADMQDGGYVYRTGDEYPRKGIKAVESRIAVLKSNSNRLGVPLIAEVIKSTGVQEKAEKTANKPRRRVKKEE